MRDIFNQNLHIFKSKERDADGDPIETELIKPADLIEVFDHEIQNGTSLDGS